MPLTYEQVRQMYPATINNDRLRKRVKWLLKTGSESDALGLLHTASVQRAAHIQQMMTNAASSIRNDYFKWKIEDEKQLLSVFQEANDQIALRLARIDPEKLQDAYLHQVALKRDIERRIEETSLRISQHIDTSMMKAADYGQTAFYEASLTAGIPSSIFKPYAPDSAIWGSANEAAVRAVIAQDYRGMPLSRRIWRASEAARDGIKRTISVGVAQGRSTDEITRAIREYMVEPAQGSRTVAAGYRKTAQKARASAKKLRDQVEDWRIKMRTSSPGEVERLLTAVENAERKIAELDKKAKDYYALVKANEKVPDKGLYKSWYKNARRMVREETNRAYREAFMRGAKEWDFVMHSWNLAASHPKPDECDDFAMRDNGFGPGVYTATDYPQLPHIGCLCYDVPVVMWDKVYPGSKEASSAVEG